MKLRPTIFLSGVSSEFASFRDAVETEVQKKDCFPLNQPSFGVDYRTIEEILRRNIGEADAVIHIVGFRFGFEPRDHPPDRLRRSYTQMEYDIARELNKPVYAFLSADASVRDSNPGEQPEDAEAIQLQLAHRQTLEQSNTIRYSIRDKSELCRLVAAIPLLATADLRVDLGRIDRYAPAELIGRESELKLLDDAWLKVRRAEPKRPHILTFVALGGEGKTSLVAKWLANLAFENWPGCDSAFAWSFYSQGAGDQVAASSDLFLKEAITLFGDAADKEFAGSNAGAYEKGQRLARIVQQRRALLIIDGLEPLQYAPTAPTPGELKDSGIAALLKGLAADNDGLCIVTTRYSLSNLKVYQQATAPEIPLTRLSSEAGVHLLKTLEVKGSIGEFEKLVEDVKGHALTLNLVGTYLRDAHGGDIRARDLVKLGEADVEEQGGHAFRVMEAYEEAFEDEGEKGKRALAILRLLGLFDRPVNADCLGVLLNEPVIPGLTGPLIGLNEAQRNLVLQRLADAKLLAVNREPSGLIVSLDAHPLLREYFATHLRVQQPDAWREAHRRLYEYLYKNTDDKPQPTLEDLQSLYQAVAHGCQALLYEEAARQVYVNRISRKNFYSTSRLGAFASDLGAVACFFETPWSRVSRELSIGNQAWMLAVAAFNLRALGRLTEALEPMRAGVKMYVEQEDWESAAIAASNLSQLNVMLGNLSEAIRDSQQAVVYADRSAVEFQRMARRAAYASALHQVGNALEAEVQFRAVEQMQAEREPKRLLLYSLRGFHYCDLLLATIERLIWQTILNIAEYCESTVNSETLRVISQRATDALKLLEGESPPLLDIALNHLTLGRVALYDALLSREGLCNDFRLKAMLDNTVKNLRSAGTTHHLPRGLLTRAVLRSIAGPRTGLESAQEDLNETWEVAERGPMRLFMADIHLYRARLFFREQEYPWESPQADLAAARKLIEKCGYWRRKEELEDAERVILKKSV